MTHRSSVSSRPSLRRVPRREWLLIAGLILLSAVPVGGGMFRVFQLASGAEVTPDNARFFASPIPVISHIIAASLFNVLGAFQFAPRFRRTHPRFHRTTGLILVPCAIVAPLSGIWMTFFYDLPVTDGDLLGVFRLIFGFGMAASVLLGMDALRQGDLPRHGAWMMRSYAICQGTSVQVFTLLPWIVIYGTPTPLAKALLMAAGWLISLAAAEWIIQKRQAGRVLRRVPSLASTVA